MIIISIKDIPKKEQRSHTHNLLHEGLKVIGINYTMDETPIVRNEHGKPSLEKYPKIHYNLSHSDGICTCMISDCECGIDCETVRAYRPKVIKRVFSETEKQMFENTSEKDRDLLFFRLWTLKEAYVKAIGIGISYPMNTASFSFDGNKVITDIKGYDFKQYILKNKKYVVSICRKIT